MIGHFTITDMSLSCGLFHRSIDESTTKADGAFWVVIG
jgi:hypothetical protein